jgi:hypothetical protein
MTENTGILIDALLNKASLKQFIFRNTINNFEMLKVELKDLINVIQTSIKEKNTNIAANYKEESAFEVQIQIGGDLLVFSMHTNVFNFDENHFIHKSKYVEDDIANSYCGMIEIYNFLADSLKYQRVNDTGYLIGRIFINRENHFIVEGKGQMGFLFNDFGSQILTKEIFENIVEIAILYCIEFDLWAPPMEQIQEITVLDKIQQAGTIAHKTSKRMGFDMNFKK